MSNAPMRAWVSVNHPTLTPMVPRSEGAGIVGHYIDRNIAKKVVEPIISLIGASEKAGNGN